MPEVRRGVLLARIIEAVKRWIRPRIVPPVGSWLPAIPCDVLGAEEDMHDGVCDG